MEVIFAIILKSAFFIQTNTDLWATIMKVISFFILKSVLYNQNNTNFGATSTIVISTFISKSNNTETIIIEVITAYHNHSILAAYLTSIITR